MRSEEEKKGGWGGAKEYMSDAHKEASGAETKPASGEAAKRLISMVNPAHRVEVTLVIKLLFWFQAHTALFAMETSLRAICFWLTRKPCGFRKA